MIGNNAHGFMVTDDIIDREGQIVRVQECSHVSEDGPHCELFITKIDVIKDDKGEDFIGLDFTINSAKKLLVNLQEIINHLETHK